MTMTNESLYLAIADDRIKFVEVNFDSGATKDGLPIFEGKGYTYKTYLDLKVGDYVVVEARGWYQIVKVVKVDVAIPLNSNNNFRWVVALADVDSWKKIGELEANAIAEINRMRMENLRQSLREAIGLPKDFDLKKLEETPITE